MTGQVDLLHRPDSAADVRFRISAIPNESGRFLVVRGTDTGLAPLAPNSQRIRHEPAPKNTWPVGSDSDADQFVLGEKLRRCLNLQPAKKRQITDRFGDVPVREWRGPPGLPPHDSVMHLGLRGRAGAPIFQLLGNEVNGRGDLGLTCRHSTH
jgi:hypothetical protein